jgi:GDP dissociation inhibitor
MAQGKLPQLGAVYPLFTLPHTVLSTTLSYQLWLHLHFHIAFLYVHSPVSCIPSSYPPLPPSSIYSHLIPLTSSLSFSFSASQVAKAAIIIGDPSYFPEAMSRKVGKVVRSICLLDHTIAGMFLPVAPLYPVYKLPSAILHNVYTALSHL